MTLDDKPSTTPKVVEGKDAPSVLKLDRDYMQFPTKVGAEGIAFTKKLGTLGFLFAESIQVMFASPFRWRIFAKQLEFIGNKSLSIVLLTGFAVGAILTLQLATTMRDFSSENMVGGIVALVLSKELGPLLAALMINGRVASAIAAEIGTMRVTEQIDALEAMSVDPVQYLISPRLFAGVVMLPFMTVIFNMVGMVASYIIAIHLLDLDPGVFFSKISDFLTLGIIFKGLAKASFFGLILTFVGSYHGYYTKGGAAGVGSSTTSAVVVGSVLIMVMDYIIGAFLIA
ncbi:MAG: ABC transporter permease [SAR324 cluster bacterium]|nr:ABC transporter permease [SAR324 cluster bacterium]